MICKNFCTLSHKNALKRVEGVKKQSNFGQKLAKNGRNLALKWAILAKFRRQIGENEQKLSANTVVLSFRKIFKKRRNWGFFLSILLSIHFMSTSAFYELFLIKGSDDDIVNNHSMKCGNFH